MMSISVSSIQDIHFLNRCQVMRYTLIRQGYDRRALVDLQLIRSSGTTIARPTCRWFRLVKKKALA